MLRVLIAKDFRRILRNPWPWLLNLALPFTVTAVIGFVFGPRGEKSQPQLARMKVAVVDEDKTLLTGALRSALTQEKAAEHIEPMFVKRNEALRALRDNQISAILIIQTNFTSRYLKGENGLEIELIKNPAQQFMPAIAEEMTAVGVAVLNAAARNLTTEIAEIRSMRRSETDWEDGLEAARRIGERIRAARSYISPPLIGYEKTMDGKPAEADKK